MLKKVLKNHAGDIFLIFLVCLLFGLNNTPGTYLSGWDNVQAELNPGLNVNRAFNSVWQEYQSFGLVSGMAHSTALLHSIVVWVLALFLPNSLIRYFVHFGLVLLGVLGVKKLFGKPFGLVGAVFYLLSFYTTQILSLPMEGFTAFFAFLPWEILLFKKFLEADKSDLRKTGLNLLLLNFVASLQFLTQTLFIVYVLVLLGFSLDCLLRKFSLPKLMRIVSAFALIIIANLFWLLPQVYFFTSNTQVVTNSKINQMATDALVSRSNEIGEAGHLVQQKSLYSDLVDSRGRPIFGEWQKFLDLPYVQVILVLACVVAFVGLFSKRNYHFAYIWILLISLTALLSSTPPFSFLNNFLRSNNLINQIFRAPFTKFSTVYVLAFAYFFVSGLIFLKDRLNLRRPVLELFSLILVLFLGFPAFTGNFLPNLMRVDYPPEYAKMTDYLNTQVPQEKRIAMLPDSSFWGWFKYRWGYEGSGFLWYGVKQPLISRTFDVWNFNGESFYWEFNNGLESFDTERVEKVLQKYQVQYVLLDRALIPITPSLREIRYEDLDLVFSQSKKLSLVKKLGSLELYEFTGNINEKSFISVSSNLPTVGPDVSVTNIDSAYLNFGDYVTNNSPNYYFPFLDFMTQTEVYGKKWKIEETESDFQFIADLSEINGNDYQVHLPEEDLLESKVFLGGAVKSINQNVTVRSTGNFLHVSVPKELLHRFDLTATSIQNCGSNEGQVKNEFQGPSLIVSSNKGSIACFGYELPLLAHWNGYLIDIASNNLSGNNLYFYILGSKDEEYAKVESLLGKGTQQFILSPGYFYNDGYVFSFQNIAYGDSEVTNTLEKLRVYLLPFDYLKEIRLEKAGSAVPQSAVFSEDFKVTKRSVWYYDVTGLTGSTVSLWQSYDSGWIALCGGKICPAEHVLVNNWANGWVFENGVIPANIRLIFWPQLLQFAGYGVLILTLLFLVVVRKKDPETHNTHS